MKDPILAKQLDELLHSALMMASPDVPIRALAERAIEENFSLFEELMREWRVNYVIRLLVAKRQQMEREQRTAQMMLPGFERLPTQITLPQGQRRPLEKATYRQLEKYLAVLRRRRENNPRIAQIKSLMELMKKWKKKLRGKSYGLTVAEVMQREAGLN
jgi:hypothetical protein